METDAYVKKYGVQKKTMSVTSGGKSPNTSLSAAKSSFINNSISDFPKKDFEKADTTLNVKAQAKSKIQSSLLIAT